MQMAIHLFKSLIDFKYDDVERIQLQKAFLKDIGVDTDFSNNVCDNIRSKCSELGSNGWVVSPFWEPHINETWYNTWYDLVKSNEKENIVDFFKENDYKLLNYIRGYARFEVSKYYWWLEAEDLFDKKFYLGCALILAAILEREIRKCPIDNWRNQTTQYFKNSVSDKITKIYENDKAEPLSRYVDTLLLIPSLDGFIKSFYNSGYFFSNGIEPDFLERNWLVHGMMDRTVLESDCIMLFNAIGSLCYVLHSLFGTDYRQ